MTDLIDEIKEKFIRCPYCRSYSVKKEERKDLVALSTEYYICDNCSKTFTFDIEEGVSKKIVDKSKNKKWIYISLIVIFILIASKLVLLIRRAENVDKNQIKKIIEIDKKSKDRKGGEKVTSLYNQNKIISDIKEEERKRDTEKKQEVLNEIKIEGEINFYNSSKFGVNWISIQEGVKVIRLSNGPLKRAGVKIGDIIIEVNGEKATNKKLMSYKNKVFKGKLDEVLVVVLRNNKKLYFKMVKKTPDEKVNKIKENNIKDKKKQISKNYLVKSASYLKVRSSSPTEESEKSRWSFTKKYFDVVRKDGEIVLISGGKDGLKGWNVDSELVVNNKVFKGKSFTKDYAYKMIPESSLIPPLDITNIIPANKKVRLKIELVDYGILWGNTDIYLVIKKKGI